MLTETAARKPKLLKAQMESSNNEERDQIDRPPASREDEAASEPGTSSEASQSDEWWRGRGEPGATADRAGRG